MLLPPREEGYDSDIRGTRARGCVSVCMCVGVREGDDDDAIDDGVIDHENNKKV